MKKSTDPSRPTGDAMSLHSNPGASNAGLDPLFEDSDDDVPLLGSRADDELPPLYSEVDDAAAGESASGSNSSQQPPHLPGLHYLPSEIITAYSIDKDSGDLSYMDKRFDSDPELLEAHLQMWAVRPPRMFARVLGTHQETVDNHGKKERKTITDFDVRVELTPYLFSDATNSKSWRYLHSVENSDKTHRGTVWARRAPGSGQSIEVGNLPGPTIREWCHMYCARGAGLKSFSLRRRVVGFDADRVRERLLALVRASNYRGAVQVSFPLVDHRIDVYNDCAINAWRLTKWIRIVFYVSLLFLIAWPCLFFTTKRFDVVVCDWPFSRIRDDGRTEYISLSEDQWYNLWGRAIHKAVLERRQCTLDQQDLASSQGAEPTFQVPSSHGAAGILRAGINAMNEINRQLGWGGDHV